MKKKFTYLFWLPVIVLSLPASAQNFALSLNGTTDYVTTPLPIIPNSGTSPFTIEFWAYVPSSAIDGNVHIFVSQGAADGSAVYIGYDGSGNLLAGASWDYVDYPLPAMPLNQWVHLALNYDGNGDAAFFVNDNETDEFPYSISPTGSNFQIGVQYDGTGFVNGEIDELRVWNTLLQAPYIKSTWWSVDPSTAGLVAYYNMNEGTGSTIHNSTATTGEDGTLQASATWASSPIQSGTNALTFDATTSTFVTVPANPLYNSPGTVEFWVNPGTITGSTTLLGVDGSSTANGATAGTQYSFVLSSSTIGMVGAAGSTPVTISLPSNYDASTWNHMAFIIDASQDTVGVYVNGVYAGQLSQSVNSVVSGQNMIMGTDLSSGTPANSFSGSLDEVRIWNQMQQPSDIVNYMNATLDGTQSGLGGLFSFDEGIAGGNNSFLTTAFDNTANNNHGTLSGFALTAASASNFTSHPISLPVNFISFTAIAQKGQSYLQWQTAQEQNSRDYSIERSTDGANYTPIGSVPAAGNSSMPLSYSFLDPAPVTGNNYYRLKEIDEDNHFMYSVIRVLYFGASQGRELFWFRTGDKAVEVDYRDGSNEGYMVYDMNGRIVQQGQLSSGKLYLNQVASGVYSVKIITVTGTELNTKVVVQ